MQSERTSVALVKAMKLLDSQATLQDLRAACRRMIEGSDLVVCAIVPFTDAERSAIAEGIFQFILSSSSLEKGWREIVFQTHHTLVGQAIEYHEFASQFSS